MTVCPLPPSATWPAGAAAAGVGAFSVSSRGVVCSSGSRVFEVVYVIWWYLGPFQKTPGMDFTSGPLQVYLLAAAGLLLLSAFWRGRQVRV